MSEPVRHTPTSGLFPSNSQNVAEILTTGMLSRDIPFVGSCLLSQKRLLAFAEAKVLPHTPLRESISKYEGPHLASKKNKLHFAVVLPGAKGKNTSSPQRQHMS